MDVILWNTHETLKLVVVDDKSPRLLIAKDKD